MRSRLFWLAAFLAVFLPTPRTAIAVVDGEIAAEGQFPFAAFLQLKFPEGYSVCSGSLIAADWVLTAAHCLFDTGTGLVLHPDDVIASVGSVDPHKGEKIGARAVFVHQDYDSVNIVNDIALVQLTRTPSPGTNYSTVRIADRPGITAYKPDPCLKEKSNAGESSEKASADFDCIRKDQQADLALRTVIAAGWGRIDPQSEKSTDVLRYLRLGIANHYYCRERAAALKSSLHAPQIRDLLASISFANANIDRFIVMGFEAMPGLQPNVLCASPLIGHYGLPLFPVKYDAALQPLLEEHFRRNFLSPSPDDSDEKKVYHAWAARQAVEFLPGWNSPVRESPLPLVNTREREPTVCHGDSGGPLFRQESDGSVVQLGLTSMTNARQTREIICGSTTGFPLFTEVGAYYSWIDDIMNGRGTWR